MSSTPAVAETAHEGRAPAERGVPAGRRRLGRWVEVAMLAVAGVFLALHWIHLKADFPNNSPWIGDWAKYTDEGWYSDAAIRYFHLGHWNVPGDFNPAAALPVWPLLEAIVFRFTGVSVAAARALSVAVFALILLASYVLLRRYSGRREGEAGISLAPALAVLLLAVSPFFYVFMRLAILEPLLILLTLLALLAASSTSTRGHVALGVLLPLMVLTKTTAVFTFAGIFWLLWASCGYRLRPFVRAAVSAGGIAAVLWGRYYLFVVRPHYLADYRYLFSANAYTGVTAGTFVPVLEAALIDGAWIGGVLYFLGLLAVVAVLLRAGLRGLRERPLPIALTLWFAGYLFFLVYHDNLQPRYYLSIAAPLTLLVALGFSELLGAAMHSRSAAPALRYGVPTAAIAAGVAMAVALVGDAQATLGFVRHPEYTFLDAAGKVRRTILDERAADPSHPVLILSISGSDLSLLTGLPSICDDFGTMDLSQRIATYPPGWYVAWNDVEDDKMEALNPRYHLQRVAAFPAFDDPERNLLIVYRLDPLAAPVTGSAAHPKRAVRRQTLPDLALHRHIDQQ